MQFEFTIPLRRWGPRILYAAVAVVSCFSTAYGETSIARPDLSTAKPQATCKLQSVPAERAAPLMQPGIVFYAQPTSDDPLASYERTALGDWPMPSGINRDDPWLRFLLLARERPVIFDVAVLIDGKPYADGREAWIDEALAPKDSTPEEMEPIEKKDAGEPATTAEPEKPAKKVIVPEKSISEEVTAQAREAPGMRERLQDYVATTGGTVDRREVRWLISEWGFGPPLVVMDRSLSWQRSRVAPLFAVLDADRSGSLDANEIAAAGDTLRRADADANDVVDVRELERKATSPPMLPYAADHPLVVALDDATDIESLAADCRRLYGFDDDRVAQLTTQPAEVTLRVELGDDTAKSAAVSVIASESPVTASDDAISIELGAEYVECSAASVVSEDAATISDTQIAVGAVVDGNPLLRLSDRNHDGQLTLRERQQIPALLESLDRDGDGTVAAAELPIPIRFAVTRGPNVHRLLAKPSTATPGLAPPATAELPDWFVAMDANRDRDLSRSEFLGTAEQFGQFDVDSDGLLSVNEALKMMPAD